MAVYQRCEATYHINRHDEHAVMRIDLIDEGGVTHFQAVLETSALRGTYGARALSASEALDFLNLAMQAEGAQEIHFVCATDTARGEAA